MSRKTTSMRGEQVDFDLFDIKNKILSAPTIESVKQRERFIDKKRRRGTSRKIDEMLAQQKQNEESVRAALKRNAMDAKNSSAQSDTPTATSDESKAAPKRVIRKTSQQVDGVEQGTANEA